MKLLYFSCFLVGLQLTCIHASQKGEESESKSAFAVFDENGEEFVIVNHEPPRDKYVAGARFINSINQTGYAFHLCSSTCVILYKC